MTTSRRQLITRLLPLAALAGCAPEAPPAPPEVAEVPLLVICTTSFAASLISLIGGDAVQARCLLKTGLSPHNYQPTAADVALIQRSDLLVMHGLGLENHWGLNVETIRTAGVAVVELTSTIPPDQLILPDGPGTAPDPHVWTDPRLAATLSRRAGELLAKALPQHATQINQRAHETAIKLEDVYNWCVKNLPPLPKEDRFFFTSHDSMRYFARACGLEARSLATANGMADKALAAELLSWLSEHKVRTMFREQETDLTGLRKLLGEYRINPDPVIYSLSLAPEKVTYMLGVNILRLDNVVDATRYNAELIITTLIKD